MYRALRRKSSEPIAHHESAKLKWKRDCFFCDGDYKVDPHNPNSIDWHEVKMQFNAV